MLCFPSGRELEVFLLRQTMLRFFLRVGNWRFLPSRRELLVFPSDRELAVFSSRHELLCSSSGRELAVSLSCQELLRFSSGRELVVSLSCQELLCFSSGRELVVFPLFFLGMFWICRDAAIFGVKTRTLGKNIDHLSSFDLYGGVFILNGQFLPASFFWFALFT